MGGEISSDRACGRSKHVYQWIARRWALIPKRWLFHTEPIPNTAHRLEPDRIGRVAFDLAAQPIDLDVDRALADLGLVADKLVARYRLARPRREDRQDLLLPVGQLQGLAATLQFTPGDLERVWPEDQLLHLRRRCRA